MQVIATRTGLYNRNLRQPGSVFEISDDVNEAGEVIALSKRWMRPVGTEIIVIAKKGRFDGTIWRNPGDRFVIPNEQAFSEDLIRRVEAKRPQKGK